MKCFQSLICPYRNLLLTADSTDSGLVESFMTGSYRPRVCKNAGTVLKSALLRKTYLCLVNQQT